MFICVYVVLTGFLCFFLMDPYLGSCVADEGLKYATMAMVWVYCFCNPFIVLGAVKFSPRKLI